MAYCLNEIFGKMNNKLQDSKFKKYWEKYWIEICIGFYLKVFLWYFQYRLNEIFGKMNNKLQNSNAI